MALFYWHAFLELAEQGPALHDYGVHELVLGIHPSHDRPGLLKLTLRHQCISEKPLTTFDATCSIRFCLQVEGAKHRPNCSCKHIPPWQAHRYMARSASALCLQGLRRASYLQSPLGSLCLRELNDLRIEAARAVPQKHRCDHSHNGQPAIYEEDQLEAVCALAGGVVAMPLSGLLIQRASKEGGLHIATCD